MAELTGKNILIAIPRNQFDEKELFVVRDHLKSEGARVVVLSKSGQQATGTNKTRFQPDGTIIDWNKQEGIREKYDAVLLTGGKGAAKSLWDDPILPQVLTDHYRAGKVIGAIGLSVIVLARASFLNARAACGPDNEVFLQELEACGVDHSEEALTCHEKILTARDGEAAQNFAEAVVTILKEEES